MEELAGDVVFYIESREAVGFIAENRSFEVFEVDSDLVGAAGMEIEFEVSELAIR